MREIPSFSKLDRAYSYSLPIVSILCTLQAEKQSNIFSDLQTKLCNLQTKNTSTTYEKLLIANAQITKLNEDIRSMSNQHLDKENVSYDSNNELSKEIERVSTERRVIQIQYDRHKIDLEKSLKRLSDQTLEMTKKESNLQSLREELNLKDQDTLNLKTTIAKHEKEIKTLKTELTKLEEKACLPVTTIDLRMFFENLKENNFKKTEIEWMQNPRNLEAFNALLSETTKQSTFSTDIVTAIAEQNYKIIKL